MAAHQKANQNPQNKNHPRESNFTVPVAPTISSPLRRTMASGAGFSYRRLDEDRSDEEEERNNAIIDEVWRWYKFRKLAGGRRRIRIRWKKLRIPGLRKFVRRRSGVFLARLKILWSKVMRRLKDGQVHMNDLFGGNYLCLQVNPNPFKFTDEKKKQLPC